MENNFTFEVAVIGGSYAGLAAAMALGRSLRKTLVIDAGNPCNRQTPHSHNFITQDGKTPSAIAKEARHQVLQYPSVEFVTDNVLQIHQQNQAFLLQTESGKKFSAKKIIVATGLNDIMPEIPGFAQSWGISVLHCPYCHGYEVRNKNIGILADGALAYEYAKLISQWSPNLTVFTNGIGEIDLDKIEVLEKLNIRIVEKTMEEIQQKNGLVSAIKFHDGTSHKLEALFSRPKCEQKSDIFRQLACEIDENGIIKTDHFQKTSVEGVYAAGDCSTLFRSVAAAVASGNMAGASVNKELIEEKFLEFKI